MKAHPRCSEVPSTRQNNGLLRLKETITRLCTDWWLVELTSWLMAFLCIVVAIAILASHDKKPLPTSPPLGLSLNAYLSVLSAIFKLAIAVPLEEALGSQKYLWFSNMGKTRPLIDFERFDDAARGPFGALRLLGRTRTRSFATIGGIICVLSLFLDPFFQQLVSLPVRPSPQNPSRIPRIRRFDHTEILTNNGSEALGANGLLEIPLGGYLVGSHDLDLANATFFCPSDKCTWPAFKTLSICSQCKDISKFLDFGCAVEPGDWRREYTQILSGFRAPDLNRTSCGWYFNMTGQTPILMTGRSTDTSDAILADDALVTRLLNMRDPLTQETYWNGTMLFPEVSAPIANFAVVNSRNISSVFENQRPDAYNCVMEWCTKTVETSYNNGRLNENIISVFRNKTQFRDPYVVKMIENYWDFTYTDEVLLKPPGDSESFSVSNWTALSVRFTFDNWIPSFLTQANDSNIQWVRFRNSFMPSEGGQRISTRDPNRAMWVVNGQIPAAMEEIANAMTTVLRNNRRISESVFGSGSPQVIVEVRWGWLAFPICVLLLTLIFLVTTMYQMSAHAKIWKSSSLTILVHGLSWEARQAFRNQKTMRDIREKATSLHVYFDHKEEGGTLDVKKDSLKYGNWDHNFVNRYVRHG